LVREGVYRGSPAAASSFREGCDQPLGLSAWEVRAGFTYEVKGTKKMDITLHDTEGKKRDLRSESDKSSGDIEEILRTEKCGTKFTRIGRISGDR
jgi:hypothetical protein